MWIVTHGLNTGMAKVIGNVTKEEMTRRQTLTCHRHPKQSALMKLPKLTVMGIVRHDYLRYCDYLDGKVLTLIIKPIHKKYIRMYLYCLWVFELFFDFSHL